jgi:7,8-dihydropterin-6-yl-methyl-4-(beta-D-ribofuranosyl)aminobenzene 5'-phosphate synthase
MLAIYKRMILVIIVSLLVAGCTQSEPTISSQPNTETPFQPLVTTSQPPPTEAPTVTAVSPAKTTLPPTLTETATPPPSQTAVPTTTATTWITPTAPSTDVEGLRITILYDNYLYDERLTPEWGFAALVEYKGHTVLFDTGGSGTLMVNMHLLGVDPKVIEAVVLSHEHLDHIGGLTHLLAEADQPTVYMLASFPAGFKNSIAGLTNVVEVTHTMEIFPGIHTTGSVTGAIREQALAIMTEGGSVIITGCSHPGIARMVREGRSSLQPGVDEYAPVALVVGGFHLLRESPAQIERVIATMQSLNVQRISPTHCTGDVAIAMFAEAFGEGYTPGGAGKVFVLP